MGNPLLIFGEAATGKTHLAYYFCRKLEEKGGCSFIAVEPGTTLFLRRIGGEFDYAASIDELARIAVREAAESNFIVIDSINWLYRDEPGIKSARYISLVSALLYEVGGVAVAQVSGEERLPSGHKFLTPWYRGIARTSREKDLFKLELIRPFKRVFAFKIRDGSVEWI